MDSIRVRIKNNLEEKGALQELIQKNQDEFIESMPEVLRPAAKGDWEEVLAVSSDGVKERDRHYKHAFEAYQEGEKKDRFCKLRLGQMYECGNYVPRDIDKAIRLYWELAEEEIKAEDDIPWNIHIMTKAQALFCLGRCYFYERNNVDEARDYFTKCKKVCLELIEQIGFGVDQNCENLLVDVEFHLSLCQGEYEKIIDRIHNYALVGNVFMDDTTYFPESRNRYTQLISNTYDYLLYHSPYKTDEKWGKIFARYLYYYLYIYIDDKKYEKAIELFQEYYADRAELILDKELSSEIGYCYLMLSQQQDEDDEDNIKNAIYWYSKASNAGDLTAKATLGIIYLYGWGVEKDIDQAKSLFEEVINSDYGKTPRFFELNLQGRSVNEMPLQNLFGSFYNVAIILYLLCDYHEEDEALIKLLAEVHPLFMPIYKWFRDGYTKGKADSILFFFEWMCKNPDAMDSILNSNDFTEEFCDLLLNLGFQLNQSVTRTVITASDSVDFCEANMAGVAPKHPSLIQDLLVHKTANNIVYDGAESKAMLKSQPEKSPMRDFFSSEVWDKLDEATKTNIDTVYKLWSGIKDEDSTINYASLINPLGTALEIECRRVFFDAYTYFLSDEFLKRNPKAECRVRGNKIKIILPQEFGESIFEYWPRFLLGVNREEYNKTGYVSIKHQLTFGSVEEVFGVSGQDDAQKELSKKQLANYLSTVGNLEYVALPFCGFWGDNPKECNFVHRCNSVYKDVRNKGAHGEILTREHFKKCFWTIVGKESYSSEAMNIEDLGLIMEMYTRVNINEVLKILDE